MQTAAPETIPVPTPLVRQTLFEHYRRLSPASRHLRFMGSLDEQALERQAMSSTPNLTLGIDCDGAPRAVLELYLLDRSHAEIGLSVEDAYQGRGYGRALFRRGLTEACAQNVETVEVNFRQSNLAIRKLCRDAGGQTRCSGGECVSRLSLGQSL